MPSWAPTNAAMAAGWSAMTGDLRAHEARHEAIATTWETDAPVAADLAERDRGAPDHRRVHGRGPRRVALLDRRAPGGPDGNRPVHRHPRLLGRRPPNRRRRDSRATSRRRPRTDLTASESVSPTRWRYLPDDGERDPRTNLAREEAIARHVAADPAAPTPVLRLWRDGPCAVVGRFQVAAAEVDLAAAAALGAPVLRRFTRRRHRLARPGQSQRLGRAPTGGRGARRRSVAAAAARAVPAGACAARGRSPVAWRRRRSDGSRHRGGRRQALGRGSVAGRARAAGPRDAPRRRRPRRAGPRLQRTGRGRRSALGAHDGAAGSGSPRSPASWASRRPRRWSKALSWRHSAPTPWIAPRSRPRSWPPPSGWSPIAMRSLPGIPGRRPRECGDRPVGGDVCVTEDAGLWLFREHPPGRRPGDPRGAVLSMAAPPCGGARLTLSST